MPTTAERHALLFLAAVACLGGAVRLASASRFARELHAAGVPVDGEDGGSIGERALARQISAVDSARRSGTKRTRNGGSTRRGNRPTQLAANRSSSGEEAPKPSSQIVPPHPPKVVDVNRATLTELEGLPRVGPALARRIVAWRESHGPFQSIDDLRHVRGIGPATASLLAPAVTF
jgi:competence protein ComEA